MPSASTEIEIPMASLLSGLGREVTARVRRAMRPLGLGAQEFLVLKQLQALGQASQATLADALAIDPSNLAAICGTLSDRVLVERARDDADRRRYVLSLSSDGERLLRQTEGAIVAAERDLLAPLEPRQRDELYALLRRVADGVQLCPTAGECAD
jgi:DNA-binding MarR family transcriptional regulator